MQSHISRDVVNVFGLVADWDGSDTGQVDQSEVWTAWRKYVQNDRVVDDDFGFSANLVGDFIDCLSHLIEISEFLLLTIFYNLIELGIWSSEIWHVIHTQLQRPSCDDTLS